MPAASQESYFHRLKTPTMRKDGAHINLTFRMMSGI
jgi:hypothetical protein